MAVEPPNRDADPEDQLVTTDQRRLLVDGKREYDRHRP
jgi:hypothetical protein